MHPYNYEGGPDATIRHVIDGHSKHLLCDRSVLHGIYAFTDI